MGAERADLLEYQQYAACFPHKIPIGFTFPCATPPMLNYGLVFYSNKYELLFFDYQVRAAATEVGKVIAASQGFKYNLSPSFTYFQSQEDEFRIASQFPIS